MSDWNQVRFLAARLKICAERDLATHDQVVVLTDEDQQTYFVTLRELVEAIEVANLRTLYADVSK